MSRRIMLGGLLGVLLGVLPAAGRLPPFLGRNTGSSLSALLSPGYQAMEQRSLAGKRRSGTQRPRTRRPVATRVALVGRPGPDGALRAVGLVVWSQAGARVSVTAATPLIATPGADIALITPSQDFDGDGRFELPVLEVLTTPSLRWRRTCWYRLSDGELNPVYEVMVDYAFGGRTERRAVVSVSPGRLDETLEIVEDGVESALRYRVELGWRPTQGRFAPLRFGVLR